MTLVAEIATRYRVRPGRLLWIAEAPASVSGLQEPRWGWMLCNGATITQGGYAPVSGLPYQPLYDEITNAGNRYGGAGVLPNFLDGRTPIPKGASVFTTAGVAGGEITHVVTLGEYPSHQHYYADDGGSPSLEDDGYCPGDGPAQQHWNGPTVYMSAYGANGAHNNMPPYIVLGAVLVKL